MSYASLQTLAKTLLWMFYGFLNFIVLLIPNTNCWWTMWNSLNPVLRLTYLSLNLWTQQIIGLFFCYFSWKVAHVLILIYWRKVTSFLFYFFNGKKKLCWRWSEYRQLNKVFSKRKRKKELTPTNGHSLLITCLTFLLVTPTWYIAWKLHNSAKFETEASSVFDITV